MLLFCTYHANDWSYLKAGDFSLSLNLYIGIVRCIVPQGLICKTRNGPKKRNGTLRKKGISYQNDDLAYNANVGWYLYRGEKIASWNSRLDSDEYSVWN